MFYNDDEELENEEPSGGLPQEQEAQNDRSMSNKASESAKKKIQEKLSKTATKNAAKQTLVKALLPVLTWVLVFILILIIIIGIVMFFITMPGMVMDQIKELAREVGNAVASWFGADTTTQVQDVDIYETLDYLEQMGYDLKGYGFLTDYVGDTQDGVERDGETDKIINAESDFISTYLISDNYVYTIKNFNISTGNWFTALLAHLGSLFSAGQLNQYWTRGMIDIWYDGGEIGKAASYYNVYDLGSITIDAERKTLEIKRGWFNNAMTYNLDGWTGRYGMPVDFLLSVHLATMMPDLSYDMATSFETVIQLLLHPVGGGASGSNTAVGYYKIGADDYKSYDDFYEAAKSGWTGALNAWRISNEEAMNILKEFGIPSPENCAGQVDGIRCSALDRDEACDACREYLQNIYDKLKDVDVSSLEIYQPYISKVTNHWYRDVYFVSDKDKMFVDYDYDYESIMKERWTLYETYDESAGEKEGEYKLYKLDGTLYSGTQEEAEKEGIAVSKKAIVRKIGDMAEDLEWNEIGNKLSAYELNSHTIEQFSPAYPNISKDDDEYEIKKDIYVKIITTGTVKQTGEGQRTETNEKIKKMFLENTYFRYDGSVETAEVITKLRRENNIDYGPLDDSDLSKTTTYNGKTYKVEDYSGKVSLNQDSLNAFSMLENEHTLDADYIYRDFKELIVELGYFEKEELTDETPRLLEFLIPNIGSYGYPRRSIDKNENEFGTMIHSKGDIEADEKQTIYDLVAKMGSEIPPEINAQQNAAVNGSVNGISQSSSNNLTSVGSANGAAKKPSQIKLQDFLDTTREMCEYINAEGYDYCVYVRPENCEECIDECRATNMHLKDGSCPHDANHCKHPPVHNNGCNLQQSFAASQESVGKHNFCCATLVSWALQNVEVMPDEDHLDGADSLATYIINNLDPKIIKPGDQLEPGDILCYEGHIDMVGKKVAGGFEKYNGGHYTEAGSTEYEGTSCIELIGGWPDNAMFALRLNWDKHEAAPYEGYLGNEEVVSPVTGILLEYDTYNDSDVDSVSGEPYRTNVDLKYEKGLIENGTTVTEPDPNQEPIADKVGYAKILVLDNENYKKIEQAMLGSTRWSSSFLKANGTYKDFENLTAEEVNSKSNPWSNADKTLYAYKEFAENYQEAGISGYVVYIDGFKCELPDENFDNESKDDQKNKSPSGEALSINSFTKTTLGNINDDDNWLDSVYRMDPEYKLASKRATDKLEAENIVKDEAAPSIFINGLRVIKEGTVLGRTLTDRELIVDYRHQNYEDFRKEETTSKENLDKVIGNYIRIIMRDLDTTVVENVEDYMKLDEPTGTDGLDIPEDVLVFMAGVLTAECGPNSEEGQAAAAWVIRNRLESGKFGATLEEILVAPNQFVVVATDPSECTGGYVVKGETISIVVNGTTYYVNAPSDLAIEVAKKVMGGNEIPNPIADRFYWKSAGTNVPASADPIQIPPGTGNKYHY